MIRHFSTLPGYLLDSPPQARPTVVDTFDRIRSFLAAVRSALRRGTALRVIFYSLAALSALALFVPLLAVLIDPADGATLAWAGLTVALAIVTLALAAGVIVPMRRWRGDVPVARFVGAVRPPLASDLLSAVELAATGPSRAAQAGHISADLVRALIDQIAARLSAIDPAVLVDRAPARRAGVVFAVMMVSHAAVVLGAPSLLAAGWHRVLDPVDPAPLARADMSPLPLVGDLRITLEHPAYTGRQPTELPSSSGDFRAMPGTVVTIETTALVPVAAARLLFEPPYDRRAPDRLAEPTSEIMVELVGERVLRARFPVDAPASYRFLIESPGGKRRLEAISRSIEIEPDAVPQVQLYAPAEELDVTSMKRVELAYIAEDDHGLAKIELVWADRGAKEQRKLIHAGEPGQRSAQTKLLWDLAEIALEPGARVTYHLEVTDNDTVRGPNVGRSRDFALRVFSPREKHEQLIARQRELFEKMLRALGGRLTVPAEDLQAHVVLQREASELVVEIGTLVTALGADELADKGLRTAFEGMRGRLDKLAKAEATVLTRLTARQAKQAAAKPPAVRFTAQDAEMVAELEDDIILLADWLDRQQMETLLAINDEIKVHQDRLRQLFDEYERTKSGEILAEIEREMRALERRLAEMAEKRGDLAEDVLDRFVNTEAMEEDKVVDCMTQVRELMRAGRVAEAQQKLDSCMKTLDRAAQAMEESLRALRSDKFSDEERKLGEIMDKLADLAQDQRDLAASADDIFQRYAASADDMMREEGAEAQRRAAKILERLRKQLERVPESGLTPFAKEELDIVEARLADLDKMLADGDIAEALAMAEQARSGLDTTGAELDAAMDEEEDEPWTDTTREARREVGRAQTLAEKLVEELQSSTPSPGEIMSPEDRRELERLARRQQAVAERARKLGERAQQMAGELPGRAGEAVAEGLQGARGHMDRAGARMRGQDPSGARQETRGAADALDRTLESGRDAARGSQPMGRAGLRDEPIRIPGADEYKAPEKFREDILEAMKREQAPDGFSDLVKRYYEELIR